jgi:SH3-like domain-containing protein
MLRFRRKGVMMKMVVLNITFILVFLINGNAGALCVTVPDANLRSGPGTNYEKTWEVFKYMPFKRISRKGNWLKVQDVDGDKHWIYKKLVTNKFNCAVVRVDKANIRGGPGTRFSKKYYSPSLKYDSYKVLTRKREWVKVLDEFGETGWIFRKLVWIY